MDCCKDKRGMFEKLLSRLNRNEHISDIRCKCSYNIALVGSPNVGKSVVFNYLTGSYVTVSNYPGTTVEVSKGSFEKEGVLYNVVDTPGMYSFLSITEEEAVTRRMLIEEKPDLVLHVVDAKNIRRMLPLTMQLIESGMNVILLLNIMDEAKSLGLEFNTKGLSKELGIPVFTSTAALGVGLQELKNNICINSRVAA